jgi:hypothetical protein
MNTASGDKKQQRLKTNHLPSFIASLQNANACLLVVDTMKCPHSQRLMEEMRISSTLASHDPGKAAVIHILDLSKQSSSPLALDHITWLPGVPCLLAASKVHLGVDAFNKSREMCRSDGGVALHDLTLLQ